MSRSMGEGAPPLGVELIRAAAGRILECDGALEPGLRAAAYHHAAGATGRSGAEATRIPDPLGGFVEKVTRNAYKVTDADVDALRSAGYSEDAVLEAVLATAIGAGVSRLEIAIAALREEG